MVKAKQDYIEFGVVSNQGVIIQIQQDMNITEVGELPFAMNG